MLRELLHLLVPLRQKLERRRRPYRSTLRRSLPQFQPARFLFDGSRASTATRLLDPTWNKDCRFFEVHDTASGHTARPQICRLTRLPARHASCTLPRSESCSTPITHKTRPAMSSLSMIPPRPSPSRTILTSALFLPCSSSMALASEAARHAGCPSDPGACSDSDQLRPVLLRPVFSIMACTWALNLKLVEQFTWPRSHRTVPLEVGTASEPE